MEEQIWKEIEEVPGEIWEMDIPELGEEDKFNVNDYLNGNYDY